MALLPLGFAWPGTLPGILIMALIAQAGLMFFDVGWETALQEGIPHARLARVASWDILISFIAMPIGSALAGPVSEAFDTHTIMFAIAAWMLAAGCWPALVRGTRSFTRASARQAAQVPARLPDVLRAG